METLADRTVSAFPVSIGTSLALESLFMGRLPAYDVDRKFEKVNTSEYNEIWINILTLHRNILGALTKDSLAVVSDEQLFNTFIEEVEIIKSIFEIEGGGRIKPFFYGPSYDTVYKKSHKNVLLRHDTTEHQLHQKHLMMSSIKRVRKDDNHKEKVIFIDSRLPSNPLIKAMILTHFPYDLLSHKGFKVLHLLESHTGILKKRDQWASKYHNGKDIPFMPFHEKLLKIFGDHVMFRPQPSKIKKLFIDISLKRKWTPYTTEEKVRFDLDLEIKDKYIINEFYDNL